MKFKAKLVEDQLPLKTRARYAEPQNVQEAMLDALQRKECQFNFGGTAWKITYLGSADEDALACYRQPTTEEGYQTQREFVQSVFQNRSDLFRCCRIT